MARIRTIKPEFWTSEQNVSCSRDARLIFIGMLNFCDDAGVHKASLVRLKGEVLPIDECSMEEIKQWVKELIKVKLLIEYEVDGEKYWQVTGWKKHQKIDKPSFRYPSIELANKKFDEYSSNSSRVLDEASTTEWKGMEGNGKEKKTYVEPEEKVIHSSDEQVVKTHIVEQARPDSLENKIFKVFDHWRAVMNHPGAVLGDKRKNLIRKYLFMKKAKEASDGKTHSYSVEQLCNAISGCAATPWNMGENPHGQRYDSLELILRDEGKIDGFIRNYHEPPKAVNGSKPSDDLSLKASKAWDKVQRAIKNPGFSRTVIFDDKIIHAVISEIAGGWREMGKIPTEKIIFLESKFVKRYVNCVNNPPQNLPERLTGRWEHEAKSPYNNVPPESLQPCFIGEMH